MKTLSLALLLSGLSLTANAQYKAEHYGVTRDRVECLMEHSKFGYEEKKRDHIDRIKSRRLGWIFLPLVVFNDVVTISTYNKRIKDEKGHKNIRKVMGDETARIFATGLIEHDMTAFERFLKAEVRSIQKKSGELRYSEKKAERIARRNVRAIQHQGTKVFRKLRRKIYRAKKDIFKALGMRRKDLTDKLLSRAIVVYLDTRWACSNIGNIKRDFKQIAGDLADILTATPDRPLDVVSYNSDSVSLRFSRVTKSGEINDVVRFDIDDTVSAEDVRQNRLASQASDEE